MKKLIIICFCLLLLKIFPVNPIGYDSYDFPIEIKNTWKRTNSLRILPVPDISYTATDSTIIILDNSEHVFHFYANCDSCNSICLNTFIDSFAKSSSNQTIELFFPEGVYYFNEPIMYENGQDQLKNFILRGAGGRNTVFHFDLNSESRPDYEKDCITFKYSHNVGIEDICIVRTDDWKTFIDTTGGDLTNAKIEHYNLGIDNDPVISKILDGYDPFHSAHESHVGGRTILLDQYCSKCWITGVESHFTHRHHFQVSFSDSIYISGCFLRGCLQWEDGGEGYGILINYETESSLFENNIIRDCRHAFGLESEARNNVIAYNYVCHSKNNNLDICLHGETDKISPWNEMHKNGPEYNLFEGNIPKMLPFAFSFELSLTSDIFHHRNFGLISSEFIELIHYEED